MNMRENKSKRLLIRWLPEALNPRISGDQVAVGSADGTILFDTLSIGQGFPADVRRAAEKLGTPDGVGIPVMIAKQMSRGARKLLNEMEISWVDQSGYGRVSTPSGIFISREPVEPAPISGGAAERGLNWSPLLSDIAESLLSAAVANHETSDQEHNVFSPAILAELVESSYPSAARSLAQFDEAGYTEKVGPTRGPTARRILRDPGTLLSDWAGYYSTRLVPLEARFHVPWRNPEASLRILNSREPHEAVIISGAYASSHLAPFLTHVPDLLAYIELKNYTSVCEKFERNADVTRVQTGQRVRLRSVGTHLRTFTQRTEEGIVLAPPVRVYADLLAEGGRSEEAAEELRREIIGW